MWSFESKRDTHRDTMLLAAPEANPHEFVRRYLLGKSKASPSQNDNKREVAINAMTLKRDREPVPAPMV
jgi:hypothetical protein